jgi:hypothetical protein
MALPAAVLPVPSAPWQATHLALKVSPPSPAGAPAACELVWNRITSASIATVIAPTTTAFSPLIENLILPSTFLSRYFCSNLSAGWRRRPGDQLQRVADHKATTIPLWVMSKNAPFEQFVQPDE